jgi:hypothetical protein
MRTLFFASLVSLGACNLIGQNGLSIGYSIDPQEFKQTIPPSTSGTLPTVACTPGVSPDPCAAITASGGLPTGTRVVCDGTRGQCVADYDVRLLQTIDLRNAKTPVPSDAVEFGISAVTVDKITYWATSALNVPTPPVDIYVAAATAKDETDPTAVKLGSIAPISMPNQCSDPSDTTDPAYKAPGSPNSQPVCSMPLSDAGRNALGNFVKNYSNAPFRIIVRATVTATGGTPVPQGTLDVFVRPTLTLSVLK